MKSWEALRLPESMSGKTFVDIGCWEGSMCAQALTRGATYSLGIDYCSSPELSKNVDEHGFSFLQLDIFSEKFLSLPEFDVVLCAGVLYHVENPKSLISRLRKLCHKGSELYIETTYFKGESDRPLMLYHPGDSLESNVSNWWSPSERCLTLMLLESSFTDVEVVYRPEIEYVTDDVPSSEIGRIGLRAIASDIASQSLLKALPRRPEYMPDSACRGSRRRR